MTEDVRRVPFRKKPMGEKFQLVFFGHPEKRRGNKIALSKWGFSWSVFFMFAAILVAGFLCCGCVTLRESDRRANWAECDTIEKAIEMADARASNDARDLSWNLKGWKELDCQGGR